MKNNKRDIFRVLTATDFKLRYQNSVLGVIWVILKPFLLFLVLFLVFSFLFGQRDPNYKLNLFLGLILMNFFQEGTTLGLYSLFWRANVILKVNFPREIALGASLTNAIISLFFNICVFVIFWSFSPRPIHFYGLLWFIFYLVVLAFLILGISLFFSILYIRFRDLSSIWEVLCAMLFYITPVIYPVSIIPEQYRSILFLNPLAVIIHNAREALFVGVPPDLKSTGWVVIATAVVFIVGLQFFRRNIRKIAEDF